MTSGRSVFRAAVLGALLAGAAACGTKTTPRPDGERVPVASAAPRDAGAEVPDRVKPAGVPAFVAEPLLLDGGAVGPLFPVEGAIMVAQRSRVGRLVGDHVEWLAQTIPPETPGAGKNDIYSVRGVWPDAIDALYTTENGRWARPTLFPITGKGLSHIAAAGGGTGEIVDVARVGASSLVVAWDYEGTRILTTRGPPLLRVPKTRVEAGCKKGEGVVNYADQAPVALQPRAAEGTPDGTLVTLGKLCDSGGPTAEVWEKKRTSRFVDLSPWLKDASGKLLRGHGDDLWLFPGDSFSPLLHFHGAEVAPLPRLPRPLREAFVSASGQLHTSDGRTVRRFEDGRWIPVGRLPAPDVFSSLFFAEDTLWARGPNGYVKLRPGPAGDGDSADETMDTCPTPLVLLYTVSGKNDKNYTYPATRKALATFPAVADLGLVEFTTGPRRLGVTVRSRAQGEALLAHLKETMKGEAPQLVCLEPKDPRTIELAGGEGDAGPR